jgi:hypothetical protein
MCLCLYWHRIFQVYFFHGCTVLSILGFLKSKGQWWGTTPRAYKRKKSPTEIHKISIGHGRVYFLLYSFFFCVPVRIVPQWGKAFFDKLPSVRAKENMAIPPKIPPYP